MRQDHNASTLSLLHSRPENLTFEAMETINRLILDSDSHDHHHYRQRSDDSMSRSNHGDNNAGGSSINHRNGKVPFSLKIHVPHGHVSHSNVQTPTSDRAHLHHVQKVLHIHPPHHPHGNSHTQPHGNLRSGSSHEPGIRPELLVGQLKQMLTPHGRHQKHSHGQHSQSYNSHNHSYQNSPHGSTDEHTWIPTPVRETTTVHSTEEENDADEEVRLRSGGPGTSSHKFLTESSIDQHVQYGDDALMHYENVSMPLLVDNVTKRPHTVNVTTSRHQSHFNSHSQQQLHSNLSNTITVGMNIITTTTNNNINNNNNLESSENSRRRLVLPPANRARSAGSKHSQNPPPQRLFDRIPVTNAPAIRPLPVSANARTRRNGPPKVGRREVPLLHKAKLSYKDAMEG